MSPFQELAFAIACVLVGMALTVWLLGYVVTRRMKSEVEGPGAGDAGEGCLTLIIVSFLLTSASFFFYLAFAS
jgi:hypothetical protein